MNTIKFTKYHIFGPNHLLSLLLYGYNYNDKYQKDQKCFLLEIFSTKQPTFIFLYNNDNKYGYPETLSSVISISADDQE